MGYGRGGLCMELIQSKPGCELGLTIWSWLFPPFVWHFRAKALTPTHAFMKVGAALANTSSPLEWRREGDSNPRYFLGTHAFQACALNHSAISPTIHTQPLGSWSSLEFDNVILTL